MRLLKTASAVLALGVPLSAVAAFADVSADHRYGASIDYVQQQGIVGGYPDGTYRPDQLINRAEFTKIIMADLYSGDASLTSVLASDTSYRACTGAYGEEGAYDPPFSDVSLNAWFAGYVCQAKKDNIVAGNPDGTFRPSANINFAEAAKIIVSAKIGVTSGASDPWWQPYIQALQNVRALPATYEGPEQLVTRGEMAAMIHGIARANDTGSSAQDGCKIAGCSSHLCVEEGDDNITTCEWREEYACYGTATCERQPDGNCGWTMDLALQACLENAGAPDASCAAVLCPVHTRCENGRCIPLEGQSDASYQAYVDGVIGNGQEAVLFFHAPWCPYCQQHDAWLSSASLGVPVYKIDFDSSTALKTQFGVVQQDTFIRIDGQGNEVSRDTFPSQAELEALVSR